MGSTDDSVRRAFEAPEWLSSADAFFQARGLSLFIMDLSSNEALYAADRCGYCHLSLDSLEPGPQECYDRPPKPRGELSPIVCRAGLTTYLAPVAHRGSVVAHAVVTGFVSSTRERRRLYEHLIGRGVREEVARLAVRGMPVVTKREIEAFARLAASIARSALDVYAAEPAAQRLARPATRPGEPGDERGVLDAAVAAAAVLDDPEQTAQHLLGSALKVFQGDAGTIALARSAGYVELVASAGEGVRPTGTKLRLEGGAAERALSLGRIVIVRGDPGEVALARRCTVVAPLMVGGEATGTLELRLPPGRALDATDAHRIERFARFTALALGHSERHAAGEIALAATERANALGCALDRLTDGDAIVSTVLEELERSFEHDVTGMVLTGWGRDRAEVVVSADTTTAELDMLVGDVAGRDLSTDPLDVLKHLERGGRLVSSDSVREDWALIGTPLASENHHGGWVFCASCSGRRYSSADNRLLEGIAAHAAAAIERATLFARIRDDFAATIAALSASLDTREAASRGDSKRVAEFAVLIGESLSLPPEQLQLLRFAGLLHDMGTAGIAERLAIGPLDAPADGPGLASTGAESTASVLEQIGFLKDVTPAVLHHHERWDGEGYPMGLKGESIPLLARVLAVADAFEGMTGTDRRKRSSYGAARDRLKEEAGAQFDPHVVEALLGALDRQVLAGATGLLASRESKGRPELPV